jgi:hypothetical protein
MHGEDNIKSRLVCFASCAVISLHLHNIGVQFFQMSVFVCLFIVPSNPPPPHLPDIPKVWSLLRMCSTSLCIPIKLIVGVFCVTASVSLTSIQGSLKNTVIAHLTWNRFHHITRRSTGKKVRSPSMQWRYIQNTNKNENRRGEGAVLSVMAGQMLTTSSNQDVQACPLWMTVCVMHMPWPERTDMLNWPTLPKS